MRRLVLLLFIVLTAYGSSAQTYFRSGIFLHHSTGLTIWGPNGSSTSVPQEMAAYNTAHSLSGSDTVTLNEEWWVPGDNEWVTQHDFFEDPSNISGVSYYFPTNKIIVIKSCFPSSSMTGAGQPSDTLSPYDKTVYNYKWHWRHIIRVMENNPDHFFVIWTNAPLEPNSTNATEAALSDWFCTWAKDTLAEGLDAGYGNFPENVYVFDFFHKLTDAGGMMQAIYASGSGDSHPNSAATQLVAPQFVEEIFDAAIYYESIFLGANKKTPGQLHIGVSPNPFNGEINIDFNLPCNANVDIALYDDSGRLLKFQKIGNLQLGSHQLRFNGFPQYTGPCFLILRYGDSTVRKNLISIK